MNKIAFLFGLVFFITGCVLAPGMKMSSPPSVPGLKIIPISADLIASQRTGPDLSLIDSDSNENLPEKLPKVTADTYKYRIGSRDILSITVWDHPELTLPEGGFRSAEAAGNVVAEDGTIFYPFVGQVHVAGKTTSEVRKILTERLSSKIVDPQLEVRVADYRSQRVFVVGLVAKPGPQPITDVPLSIVEAINQAGGVIEEADKLNATLTREGQKYEINLLAFYEEGELSKNLILKNRDILYIPNRFRQRVFVLGEVGQPTSLLMDDGRMTLTDAIGNAGGVDQVTANPELIYVIRGDAGHSAIYHLDSTSADALLLGDHFQLKPRDVVFVGTAGVTRWNRVISQILPSAQLLGVGARIENDLR